MNRINAAEGGYRLGGYAEHPVAGGLRRYVDVGWSCSRPVGGRGGGIRGWEHRVIPETGVSLCFFSVRDGEGRVEAPELILLGPVRSPRLFRPEPGRHIEGVRVKAEWCRSLLGVDPGEHADGVDPLPRSLARRVPGLLDRLAGTVRSGAAVRILSEAVRALTSDLRRSASAETVSAALEEVRGRPNLPLSLGERCRGLGVSERHLRRLVRRTTGWGPKYFHRIGRLHYAVSLADGALSPEWSRLAAAAGFCDQSHLIREFRSLTGLSPVELRAGRNAQQGIR